MAEANAKVRPRAFSTLRMRRPSTAWFDTMMLPGKVASILSLTHLAGQIRPVHVTLLRRELAEQHLHIDQSKSFPVGGQLRSRLPGQGQAVDIPFVSLQFC